jgi:PKD repeat protein
MSKRFETGHSYRAAALTVRYIPLLLVLCMPAASEDWPDCGFHCTAGDVTLESAYLGDVHGNPLPPCSTGGTVDAYLWIHIYNNANSPRHAVILLADIYINGSLEQSLYDDGLCVLDSVPPKADTSYPIYNFEWICGQDVKLTRMILSWETQSGTTCQNANRKCSNRNTKCYGGSTIEVTVDRPLVPNFTSSSPKCCCSLSFTDSTSGGTAPYAYSWNFGDGHTSRDRDPVHTYSQPGTYSVVLTVSDGKGISSSTTKQVTLYQNPSVSFTTNSPVCDGNYIAFIDGTIEGAPSYTYNWSFGDGSSSKNQSPMHAYPGPGIYNVTLNVTDSNGCSDTAAGSVVVNQRPNVDAGPDKSVTSEGSVQIGGSPTAFSDSQTYTYLWRPTDTLSDASISNPTASPEATTKYTVEVSDARGCTLKDSVVVYVSGISLAKDSSATSATPGDAITYDYVIKNIGDVEVSGLTIGDDKLGVISGLNKTSLLPGEAAATTAQYLVKSSDLPGPLVNNAIASGIDTLGLTLSSRDEASVSLSSIPLKPVLNCVRENGDGTYTAFFGYVNDGIENIYLPIGSKNGLSPSPQDRGQPVTFLPGTHQFAFSSNLDGTELGWNLAGQSAAASKNSDICSSPGCLIDGPGSVCLDASDLYTSNGEEISPYTYTYSWKMNGNYLGSGRSIEIIGANYSLGNHLLELEIQRSYRGMNIDTSSCNLLVKIIPRPSATIDLISVV